MSKKKGKAAAKKAPKKKAAKEVSRAAAAPGGDRRPRRRHARRRSTIFIFRHRLGQQDPHLAAACLRRPRHVEWTVVNLIDGTDVPVTIYVAQRQPVGQGADSRFAAGNARLQLPSGVKPGRFKYVVHALDAQEDPEIEIPRELALLPLRPQHAAGQRGRELSHCAAPARR